MSLYMKYSEFPLKEYRAREEKARQLMKKYGFDALLVSQKENVEYLSGFMNGFWDQTDFAPGTFLLPREGDPILFAASFMEGTARGTSWVKDVRLIPGYPPGERYPPVIVEAIKNLNLETSTIGVESGRGFLMHMPLIDFETIKMSLKSTRFADAGSLIWELRMIKSQLELERMKKALEITQKGFEKVFGSLRDGITEREVRRIINTAYAELGADRAGFINLRSSVERHHMPDTLVTDEKIRKGELFYLDSGAVYRGYWADISNNAFIGKPPSKVIKIYNAIWDAINAGMNEVKPGIKAHDVNKAVMKSIKKSGYAEGVGFLEMCGHGLGLGLHELPYLAPRDNTDLRPGMTMCIEPWIWEKSIGVFSAEVEYLVTEEGAKTLSAIDPELRVI